MASPGTNIHYTIFAKIFAIANKTFEDSENYR